MKMSAALLCLLLAVAALSTQGLGHRGVGRDGEYTRNLTAAAPYFVVFEVIGATACCINLAKRSISVRKLEGYRTLTNSRCPQEAVIFKTKQAKEVCANPKDKWVQRAMNYLDKKSQTPKP